eukprot:PhF_6_TR2247/c0_g1_i1/m.3832
MSKTSKSDGEQAEMLASIGALREAFAIQSKILSDRQQEHGDPSMATDEVKMSLGELAHGIFIQEVGTHAQVVSSSHILPEKESDSAPSQLDTRSILILCENLLSYGNTLPSTRRTNRYRLIRGNVMCSLGCSLYHARRNRAAAQMLQKAVDVLATVTNDPTQQALGSALLSLAAALSRVGKHKEALQRAQEALNLNLHAEATVPADEHDPAHYGPFQVSCYYNIAVEQEYLQLKSLALKSYQTAFELAFMSFGVQHPFTQQIKLSYNELRKKVEVEDQQTRDRDRQRAYLHNLKTLDKSVSSAAMAYVDLNAEHKQRLKKIEQTRKEERLERSFLLRKFAR